MQQALCVVKAFPYLPGNLRLLQASAAMQHEPDIRTLTQPGHVDDYGHFTRWQQLVHLSA